MNGLTFYFCIGKYDGWKFGFDGPAVRIVLGWIAIVIMLRDIEQDIQTLIKIINQYKAADTRNHTNETRLSKQILNKAVICKER